MREFDYKTLPQKLLTNDIVNMIAAIHEYKGKQDFYIKAKPDALAVMLEIAKIQSTEASNRIEGIVTTKERLKAICTEKVQPRNRPEREIAGYREVLALVHESYDYMPPRPNILLQMHRNLYQYSQSGLGGNFKNTDNVIEEAGADGKSKVRFVPIPAFETPDAIERLTTEYINAVNKGEIDPLILIPSFILDFLCIHPFNDGNGRMSRLLTLLLLYRSGYIVGKYISLEMIIEKTKDSYYDVLRESSENWHESSNDYLPFVRYTLGIILNAYTEFASRIELMQDASLSKPARIKRLFDNTLGIMSKQTIAEKCPDISTTTIEQTLGDLLKAGYIVKLGSGRSTAYIKKTE
jgi:Fic family protein